MIYQFLSYFYKQKNKQIDKQWYALSVLSVYILMVTYDDILHQFLLHL